MLVSNNHWEPFWYPLWTTAHWCHPSFVATKTSMQCQPVTSNITPPHHGFNAKWNGVREMATDVWTQSLITCYTYPAHYEAVSDNMFHEGYYNQWTGGQVHRTQDPGPRSKQPGTQDLGPRTKRPRVLSQFAVPYPGGLWGVKVHVHIEFSFWKREIPCPLNVIVLGYIRSLQALTVHFWDVMYVL